MHEAVVSYARDGMCGVLLLLRRSRGLGILHLGRGRGGVVYGYLVRPLALILLALPVVGAVSC
jgi:hypothetical protein